MKDLGLHILFALVSITLLAQTPNPGAVLNSKYDELNPVLSADGKTIYLTIANHPENVGGLKDPGDIWYAERTADNSWSKPVHAGNNLNNKTYNAVAGLSQNGENIFLLSHYNENGIIKTQGLAISKRTDAGWTTPINIVIPYFQNKSDALHGYISSDQTVFVYAAETYGTRGVEDIYVTINKNGKWSEPKNLGSKINTQFQELSPSLSADGNTLYFSSNGRKGNGSFDIYASTRVDDSWINWTEPVNIGHINTEGRDLFYREYQHWGIILLTSTKNSDGYGDIKLIQNKPQLDAEVHDKDTITPITIKDNPIKETPIQESLGTIAIYGKVINAKTGEAIKAKVVFEPIASNAIAAPTKATVEANPASGYSLDVSNKNSYRIAIVAQGYISAFEKLDINTFEMKELEMNFKLQPVEVGTTVNLKDILFEQGKTLLLPQSYPELDMVVAFLKENPKVKIELGGHTDNRGIPSQNLKLSQARVEKVKSYLVEKGIDKKRISGKGYGGSKPIANNDSEETRQLNRRVEFTIKKL